MRAARSRPVFEGRGRHVNPVFGKRPRLVRGALSEGVLALDLRTLYNFSTYKSTSLDIHSLSTTIPATMTKRKSEEEKAAGKSKRRVPFTAAKDAATKALYARASTYHLQP